MLNKEFYQNKKVFVTGHTGFKGAWICKALKLMGAEVSGYALLPNTNPSLFRMSELYKEMESFIGDIRDFKTLNKVVQKVQPEVVIHMAAQPLVLEGYSNPRYTYETNVLGTVNLLDAVRRCNSIKCMVNVTTDKVYENLETQRGYVEEDTLDGFDPYSNSKSCSELVTACYNRSYFKKMGIAVSTARAGNVIGGGDFAENRVIPDCVRAAEKGSTIIIRNPNSVRPYQHVLEPLYAYLLIAEKSYNDPSCAGSYNIACDDRDCITTAELATIFCKYYGENTEWMSKEMVDVAYHEANLLKLDATKIKNVFGWSPRWNIERAVERTVEFAKEMKQGASISYLMEKQINEFFHW